MPTKSTRIPRSAFTLLEPSSEPDLQPDLLTCVQTLAHPMHHFHSLLYVALGEGALPGPSGGPTSTTLGGAHSRNLRRFCSCHMVLYKITCPTANSQFT